MVLKYFKDLNRNMSLVRVDSFSIVWETIQLILCGVTWKILVLIVPKLESQEQDLVFALLVCILIERVKDNLLYLKQLMWKVIFLSLKFGFSKRFSWL